MHKRLAIDKKMNLKSVSVDSNSDGNQLSPRSSSKISQVTSDILCSFKMSMHFLSHPQDDGSPVVASGHRIDFDKEFSPGMCACTYNGMELLPFMFRFY